MGTILDEDRGILYSLGSELGSGSYGRCVLAIDKCTGQKFACKTQKDGLKFESEVKIHANLRHVNIVQLVSSFMFCDKQYLIMELCHNGSLKSFMSKIEFLNNPEVRCIAKQIVSGLKYLRQKFIIHRDLTLSNVLLDTNLTIKIADFGLAIKLKESCERRTTFCGTLNYVAPEVVREEQYGFQVDIWALGCIIYVLLTGNEPFQGRNEQETYENIVSIKYWASPKLHKKANDLIKTIFVNDPHERLNVFNILNHPYFKTGRTPRCLPKDLKSMYLIPIPALEWNLKTSEQTYDVVKKDRLLQPITAKENHGTENKTKKHNMVLRSRDPQQLRQIKNGEVANVLEGHTKPNFIIYDEAGEENVPSATVAKMSAKELALCLKKILLAKVKKTGISPTNAREPFICVTRWVGFLDSGFAYHLSDGSLGLYLENASVLHRKQGGEIYYQPAIGDAVKFTKDAVPNHLTELMRLMSVVSFKLLELNRSGPIACSTDPTSVKRIAHFRKGEDEAYHSTAMFLSNGTCQINFADHEKMVINKKDDALIFLRPDDTTEKYSLTALKLQGVPIDIRSRLEHAFTFLANID